MYSTPISPTKLASSSRLVVLAVATVFLGSNSAALAAYSFLTVSGTGTGNATATQFSGTNGIIKVSHNFSPGGAGANDNNNFLNPGFHPGQFTTLFPGTGLVQGHLAQTVYGPAGGIHTSDVTFDFSGYTLTPNTVFGIWNTTDELTQPVTYKITVIDNSFTPMPPSTFNLIGNQDNQTQVAGRHNLVMNPATGDITTGALINAGGTHMNAAFWDKLIIPTGTQQIIVHGSLTPLNNIGDGVGYYFAELIVPEPSTFLLMSVCLAGVLSIRRRSQNV